jgi:hypothetical protein
MRMSQVWRGRTEGGIPVLKGAHGLLKSSRQLVLAAGALALVAAGAGIGVAEAAVTSSTPSRVIHACYVVRTGAVRVVRAGERCPRGQRSLAWNRVGARGPRGNRGPAGSAAAVAWAYVDPDGSIASESGVASVSVLGPGDYCVSLSGGAASARADVVEPYFAADGTESGVPGTAVDVETDKPTSGYCDASTTRLGTRVMTYAVVPDNGSGTGSVTLSDEGFAIVFFA